MSKVHEWPRDQERVCQDEGWFLDTRFDEVKIAASPYSQKFEDNAKAKAFVLNKARNGSLFHLRASGQCTKPEPVFHVGEVVTNRCGTTKFTREVECLDPFYEDNNGLVGDIVGYDYILKGSRGRHTATCLKLAIQTEDYL